MRHLRANDLFSRSNPVLVTRPSGIIVNQSVVDALDAAGWLPPCRVYRTGFRSLNGYKPFTVANPCDAWWCPRCGVLRLETLLGQVRDAIRGLTAVYTAECLTERTLSTRVRQRAHDHEADFFWYCRSDGQTFYVASKPLPGRGKPPSTWTKRTPDHAIEWLKTFAITFSGHRAYDRSPAWEPITTPPDHYEEDPLVPRYQWFNLDRTQGQMVARALADEVRERFGVELPKVDDDPWVKVVVEGMLQDIVKRVQNGE
jgi:hypothetical protein